MSVAEIMALKAVYSIVIVALELPSGYFADVLGRKKTLIIGALLGAIGFYTYSFTHVYIGFLLAEVALGAGQSFISGADSAMMYDTLASGKRQKDYARYEGINASVGNFSEAFAGIAGGAIALISLRLPFYAQAVIASTAIPAAFTLVEPSGIQPHKSQTGMRDMARIMHTILFREKVLRFNILFSSIIGSATLLMAWFAQPLFEKILLPLALYGAVWTMLNLIAGGSAIFAHRVEKWLGETGVLKILAIIIPLLMIVSGIVPPYAVLPLLAIFYVLRGVATPVLKDYINQRTNSQMRATVMSLRDLLIRVCFAVFAPLAGWVSDQYSLAIGLSLAGGVFLLLSLLTLGIFLRYRKPYL